MGIRPLQTRSPVDEVSSGLHQWPTPLPSTARSLGVECSNPDFVCAQPGIVAWRPGGRWGMLAVGGGFQTRYHRRSADARSTYHKSQTVLEDAQWWQRSFGDGRIGFWNTL